jgi:hypothetical protein
MADGFLADATNRSMLRKRIRSIVVLGIAFDERHDLERSRPRDALEHLQERGAVAVVPDMDEVDLMGGASRIGSRRQRSLETSPVGRVIPLGHAAGEQILRTNIEGAAERLKVSSAGDSPAAQIVRQVRAAELIPLSEKA